jgi:hypothetical protein
MSRRGDSTVCADIRSELSAVFEISYRQAKHDFGALSEKLSAVFVEKVHAENEFIIGRG